MEYDITIVDSIKMDDSNRGPSDLPSLVDGADVLAALKMLKVLRSIEVKEQEDATRKV